MREGHEHKGKRGHREHREHREHGHHHPKSAQTFRRGRATAFLDKLNVNRSTLQRQLNEPEFESIKQVISGELKATEAIIEEFIHMFQLHELSSDDRIFSDNTDSNENAAANDIKSEDGNPKNENN
ncbi:hypothetical protein [Candidatus Pristimantibacillus sp. PTI5]|uniref:hypothetical protein n=1 Tax=Candidatus Pristimantibacillus sp. PTI5 TaxID=3400422 RepID=UPI003B012366